MWLTELLSSENKRHVSVQETEPRLMATFKQTLTKRTKEQKGQRANRSPQWKLIDNVLIEVSRARFANLCNSLLDIQFFTMNICFRVL